MSEPLPPIALYARLVDASATLVWHLHHLGRDHPLYQTLDADWGRLDDLIEHLPAALAWEAEQRQDREEDETPRCRWCGQPVAAHPQEGAPWRCRVSDGPRLPREDAGG
jgi:hypothetical protein